MKHRAISYRMGYTLKAKTFIWWNKRVVICPSVAVTDPNFPSVFIGKTFKSCCMLYWNVLEKGIKWSDFPSSTPFLPPLNSISMQWEKSLLFKIHSHCLVNCRFFKMNTYGHLVTSDIHVHLSVLTQTPWGSEGLTLDFTVMPPSLWIFVTSAPNQVKTRIRSSPATV